MEVKRRTEIIIIVMDDIPMGTQTGAIQGRGIKKSTSVVVNFGGHLINIYKET